MGRRDSMSRSTYTPPMMDMSMYLNVSALKTPVGKDRNMATSRGKCSLTNAAMDSSVHRRTSQPGWLSVHDLTYFSANLGSFSVFQTTWSTLGISGTANAVAGAGAVGPISPGPGAIVLGSSSVSNRGAPPRRRWPAVGSRFGVFSRAAPMGVHAAVASSASANAKAAPRLILGRAPPSDLGACDADDGQLMKPAGFCFTSHTRAQPLASPLGTAPLARSRRDALVLGEGQQCALFRGVGVDGAVRHGDGVG